MATVAGRGERARKDTPKKSVAATTTPADEEVRLLAYYLYERRCESGAAGDAAGDWIQAEHLLLSSTRANANSN
jgi:hypothetical protein